MDVDRRVNVLELLVLIICLLVLNQSELTLPATGESGLASEQFCNEFSIDMGRGFYPQQCKYHSGCLRPWSVDV